jgi:hypothetical protein
MPRGPKGEKRPADVIGNAVHVMRIATGEIEDSPSKAPKRAKGGLSNAGTTIRDCPSGSHCPMEKGALSRVRQAFLDQPFEHVIFKIQAELDRCFVRMSFVVVIYIDF